MDKEQCQFCAVTDEDNTKLRARIAELERERDEVRAARSGEMHPPWAAHSPLYWREYAEQLKRERDDANAARGIVARGCRARDEQIAALTAEVARLRGALEEIAKYGCQDPGTSSSSPNPSGRTCIERGDPLELTCRACIARAELAQGAGEDKS